MNTDTSMYTIDRTLDHIQDAKQAVIAAALSMDRVEDSGCNASAEELESLIHAVVNTLDDIDRVLTNTINTIETWRKPQG